MNKHQTCDPERIELFLEQKLSGVEQSIFESHLSTCGDCRQRLESAAANEDLWSEICESLRDEPLPPDDLRSGDSDSTGEEASSSQATVLKLLAPTDDDRMLGRWGTYEVVGVVGTGGMGVVLKALDAALNRYVAIKVLAPHLGSSGAARRRFSREAQAAAAVVHDNVIEIYGVAEYAGLPYLVMPYVRGPSLQRRLDDHGPLGVAEILGVGMQAAAGLAAAHAQGLVHRDVKPANILLADGIERVKLTDFGLARAADDASLTKTGIIAGTPQYMSPEQACGEAVDQRSDLFSLGSVLYATCTGRAPFRAETSYGVLRHITDEEPRPIREINPDIPDWLCWIIAKLMSKEPAQRFHSAQEVAELLEACLSHVQQPTNMPLPAAIPLPAARTGSRLRRILQKGSVIMIATFGVAFLGMLLMQATDPPDIAGRWAGEDWGQVVLRQTAPGEYTGTYTETVARSKEPGKIELKWSRVERRFNGTWREGDDRFGDISLRLAGNEIRGAITTDAKSKINPATPRLADLLWVRGGGGEPTSPPHSRKVSLLLSDCVAKFNEAAARHPIGKYQSPLTDDEVIASMCWLSPDVNEEQLTPQENEQLRSIAETRMLPEGWQFEVVTDIPGVDMEQFRGWFIQLARKRVAGGNAIHIIRQQLLCQLGADGNPLTLPDLSKSDVGDDATPLAAAIKECNRRNHNICGLEQKPLTEEEVLAAIRWWKTRRNEAPVSDNDFAAFQKIADTRQLSKGALFEVLCESQPPNGSQYFAWLVRIRMSKEPYGTYAYEIRNQYIRSKSSDAQKLKDSRIAWGPAGTEELQAGVRVEPVNEVYMAGQQVTPIFCFRNTGQSTLDALFPRLMTRGYYNKIIAVDATGKAIPIEQNPGLAGPVGWIKLSLPPGAQHEISGLPIVLGDVDRGSAETAIRARPGESIRIRFELTPDLRPKEAKPLQTGELMLLIEYPANFDRAKKAPGTVDSSGSSPPTRAEGVVIEKHFDGTWTATLSGGEKGSMATVQLAEVRDGGRCWRPDGTLTEKSPVSECEFEKLGAEFTPKTGVRRGFFVWVCNRMAEPCGLNYEVAPRSGLAGPPTLGLRAIPNNSTPLCFVAWVPETAHTVTVRVGISTGPWEDIASATYDETGKKQSSSPGRVGDLGGEIEAKDVGIAVSRGELPKHGVSWVLQRNPAGLPSEDLRVIGLRRDGAVVEAEMRLQGPKDGKELTALFVDAWLRQFKEIKLQHRRYHWVEFRDVALQPDKIAPKEKRPGMVTRRQTVHL